MAHSLVVQKLGDSSEVLARWDKYVDSQPRANLFFDSKWRVVIRNSLGYEPSYLFVEKAESIVGICPLFIVNTGLFGKCALSLPFVNYGGIVADDSESEQALIESAAVFAKQGNCKYIEFRQRYPLFANLAQDNRKIASFLDLTGGSDSVFKRLHHNVRNKIRKAEKNQVEIRSGLQYLDDFYQIYSHNLRDLGTPVISKLFFHQIAEKFPGNSQIYVAFRGPTRLAAKFVLFDKYTCFFVWSASIRAHLQYAPVQSMNWKAIEDAIQFGCQTVDFGRSTKNSSHEEFKKFWGVQTEPLPWCYHLLGDSSLPTLNKENPKYRFAIACWKRLPLSISRLIGPPLASRLP